MSAADEFPLPPGDPGRVRAAGTTLQRVAGDVTDLATTVRAERAGMAAAWTGAAGEAAAAETGALATLTGTHGRRLADGAAAVVAYGTALETAVTEVQAIRRQAGEADQDARSEAARTGRGLPPEDRQALYTGLREQALAPLRQRYRSVLDTLRRAGAVAAGALTDAVPEYRSGMTPAAIALAVRDAAAARLPSLLQQDGQRRGAALAAELAPLLERGDRIPDALLARMEADKDNPWFAKTLLETLGPQAPGWAMAVMESNGTPVAYNERTIRVFAELLALGTRVEGAARLSDQYVDTLLRPLDPQEGVGPQYAWHLAHLLHFGGRFGEPFLTRAGDRLYALDRYGQDEGLFSLANPWPRRPLTGERVPDDAMESYFGAVADNPRAAQAFFAGHPDRLTFYLVDRQSDDYLGDHGASLGRALEAATTSLRDDGADGRRSAQVAADLVRVLGAQEHGQLAEGDRAAVLPSVARILNSYSDDVFYALSRSDYGGAAESAARLGQPELGGRDWGVDFSVADLRGVLAQVDHDTEAYKSVMAAQLSASELFLQDKLQAARQDPLQRDTLLQSYARSHGLVLRQLFDTHLNTQVAMGKLADFDRVNGVRWGDTISGSIVGIIPAIPHPAFQIGGMALGIGRNLLMPGYWEDATRPGATTVDRVTAESGRQLDAWYSGNLASIITTMQDGGGFAGTPAEAAGWQDRQGIPADARFTDDRGRVVDPASMTEAQRAAYGRWMSDPENEAVRLEMVRMFTALDAGGSRGPR